jgi:tetratricopeptide (TPR) repeat protein
MSGAARPRRFPGRLIAGLCAALAPLAPAANALAQDPSAEPRAATIIGGDANGRRCGAAIAQGVTDDNALRDCERALRYPRLSREAEVQIRVNLGVMRLRRGEHQMAVDLLDAVIADFPRSAEAHMNRGAALLQMRQYGPAVTAFTEALSLGVAEPHKAYFNRGAAREGMRDLRGAYEDYSTALEIRPDWGPANAELARFARDRRAHLAGVLGDELQTQTP